MCGSLLRTFMPFGTSVLSRFIHSVSVSFSTRSASVSVKVSGILCIGVISMWFIEWCGFMKCACTYVGGDSGCMC